MAAKKILIIIIILFSAAILSPVSSADGDRLLNINFTSPGISDDVAYGLAVDSNDNVYVVGYINNSQWWIKKFNSSGYEDTANWNKTIGIGSRGVPYSIKTDSYDNIYVAGLFELANMDWVIKRYNSSGTENLTWNKTYDGNSSDDLPLAIAVDSLNDVWIAGFGAELNGVSLSDWWIMKFEGARVPSPATPAPSNPSSGRSSTAKIKTIEELTLETGNEYDFILEKNEEIKFNMQSSQQHSLKVSSISGKKVKIEISSNPISFWLNEGESKEVDLDEDNINDISVFAKTVAFSDSNIIITALEQIKITEEVADTSDAEEEALDSEFQSAFSSTQNAGLVVIFILVVLLILLLSFVRVKNQ